MSKQEIIKKDLEDLKETIKKTIKLHYGVKGLALIKGMRTSKNGLFVYGKDVTCKGIYLGYKYKIEFYISWYDHDNYSYINDLVDLFVLDNKRLGD